MHKSKLRWLGAVLAVAVLPACQQDGKSDAADSLLTAFASGCQSSMGSWTSAALSQTETLRSTLEILAASQDEACQGAGTMLSSLETLSTQLSRLTYDSDTRYYLELKQTESSLIAKLTELAASSDADDVALAEILQSSLYSTQASLVSQEAKLASNTQIDGRDRLVSSLGQVATLTEGLLADAPNLARCYAAVPQMATQLAGSVLAVAGNFFSPQLGAAFAAIGQLLTASVETLRTLHLQLAILNVESTKMTAALTCGLESMVNLYCSMEDNWRLVSLASESVSEEGWEPKGVWKGIDLVNERLPVLVSWLQQVRGGVEPPNLPAAEYIAKFWNKLSTMQNSRLKSQGIFQETETFLNGITDEAIRQKFLKDALKQIFSDFSGGGGGGYMGNSSTHPVNEYFSDKNNSVYACRIMGYDDDCGRVEDANHNVYYNRPDDILSLKPIIGDLPNIRGATFKVLDEVEAYAYEQVRKVSNLDVARLLQSSRQAALKNPYSPLKVIEGFRDYLKDLTARSSADEGFRQLADETRKLLDDVLVKLDDPAEPAGQKIKFVFESFQLRIG